MTHLERQDRHIYEGRWDLIHQEALTGSERGGVSPEIDIDEHYGSELVIDQVEKLPSDFSTLDNLIEDALHDGGSDALEVAYFAQTAKQILHEFHDDGEECLLRDNAELRVWFDNTLAELHPNVSAIDRHRIIRDLEGFPPMVRTQDQYELAT